MIKRASPEKKNKPKPPKTPGLRFHSSGTEDQDENYLIRVDYTCSKILRFVVTNNNHRKMTDQNHQTWVGGTEHLLNPRNTKFTSDNRPIKTNDDEIGNHGDVDTDVLKRT